jgi:phosphate transport system substrate-binding protein
MKLFQQWVMRAAAVGTAVLFASCGGEGADGRAGGADGELGGRVEIDGSSTVYPVGVAVAEEFQIQNRGVRVTVGYSGTGGGFKRFCAGETDISGASREISESEREACAAAGVAFVEVPIAWDGLSLVANPENDFVECLTVDELRRIWEPGSTVRTWRDVRPDLPSEEIQLYGPGTDSGTFDYFTEVIVGEAKASRADYQASEDDNILVQGVAGDVYALGYFGYAYVVENRDRLKLLGVDGGAGCVLPSEETIADGSYAPLSRPLYMYVSLAATERPEVRAFVDFMLDNATELVPATGYHPLDAARYREIKEAIAADAADIQG